MSKILSGAMAVLVLAACGGQDAVVGVDNEDVTTQSGALSWTAFLSKVHQVPGEDVFVVNGDETVEGWKKLHTFYEEAVLGQQRLIIDTWGGVDSKWTDTQKLNLTYCVSNNFGTRKATVVQAMADAAGAWSAAANVKFVYVSAQDGSCTTSNNSVLFDVRPVNVNGNYLARAFFPGDSRSARSVEIDNSAFTSSGNPTLTGILRHELGHTLGFRHEHTRPEAGACFEDNNWRVLTSYDSASVMHYPQCNGTGNWALTLTAKDIAGAQSVYGAAGGGGGTTPPPPPPPPATGTTQVWNGTVAQGQSSVFPKFTVKPGTTFTVVMTGTGDPDLYVRFGSAPTSTKFACRPYLDGPNETCSLTVPAGQTAAYVKVVGYTAATFSATVTWTQ